MFLTDVTNSQIKKLSSEKNQRYSTKRNLSSVAKICVIDFLI